MSKYDCWAGEPLGRAQMQLRDAALRLGVSRSSTITFAAVVAESGLAKGTAYRAAPDHLASVLQLLNLDTVQRVFVAAFRELDALADREPNAGFVSVVEAGITGVFNGLASAPWIRDVLWNDCDEITAYLVRREDGSIFARLVGFAAWCARNRGADHEKAKTEAERLVWDVLLQAVKQHLPDRPVQPNWPGAVGPGLRASIQSFADNLDLLDAARPGLLPDDLFLSQTPGSRSRFAMLSGASH